jgi:hypothetical protein
VARDPDLDLFKAIRLCAFGAVKNKDSEYLLRYICRWYSREFSTPLAEVYDIPLEELLQHFFECRYEDMGDEELEAEAALLRETQAERLEREAREREAAMADDEFFRQVKEEARQQALKNPVDLNKKIEPSERPLLVPAPVMGEVLPTTFAEVAAQVDPKLKTIPPDIKMSFVDESELGNLDEWDVLGPPKPDGK